MSTQAIASFTLGIKTTLVRIYTVGKKMKKRED